MTDTSPPCGLILTIIPRQDGGHSIEIEASFGGPRRRVEIVRGQVPQLDRFIAPFPSGVRCELRATLAEIR